MVVVLTLLTVVLFVAGALFIYDDWQYKKLLRKDRKLDEEDDTN